MKRFLPALTIGVLVSAIVLTLHISGAALRAELPLSGWISNDNSATKLVSEKLQYALVFLLAAGVAWMALETKRRGRFAAIIGVLVLELLGVAWVCALYQTFFQPLPAMLAALFALGAAAGFVAAKDWIRARPKRIPVPKPVVVEPMTPLVPVAIADPVVPPVPAPIVNPTDAIAYVVTAVVCDIGNKHDLIDELEPAAFVEIAHRFIAHATKVFADAGAHVESASGEGVVAIFGYPQPDSLHAEKATREAMQLVASFPGASSDPAPPFELHAGVSSGKVIMAPSRNGRVADTLTVGEPIELARRFCIANRFYGSRVLIGPGTFELAANALVARPIDFVSGVDARERHEIYEPLSASHDVPPEDLMRRDSFWNGVVLYREKRWAESYAQFQKARGPNESDDAPLQLYLRRLEPLALQLIDAPSDD